MYAFSELITFASKYQNGESTAYAWELLGMVAIISIYYFIAHDFSKYLIYQIAENVNIDAQKKTLRHLYDLDMSWQEKDNTGNKMQKIFKGGGSFDAIIRIYEDLMIESAINLIAILIILAFFNIILAAILFVFFITYYFLSLRLTQRAAQQSHMVNLQWEKFNGVAFESVNNISLVKSLRIADRIFPFLEKISRQLAQEIKKRIRFYRVREGILNLYQEFFRLLLIGFTLQQIFSGHLEVGMLALVFLYFGKIENAAFEFSQTAQEFITAKRAVFRMKEILQEKPSVEDSGDKVFPTEWKLLSLKNITFSYHGQKVLKKFSLDIRRGEKVGIVGISGTGKSTLFKLLLKLYNNYEGEICFDGIPLRDIRRASYAQSVAVVPQETELFHLSLAQNITLHEKNRNEALFQKSLDIAHVSDFSHKLPEGIHALVGEKGIRLSGGEKQRVGIARAIYQKPELLFLDETTSHLDFESEKKIQEALHTFFRDITAVVIAHRLSTLREMDTIVVMKNGAVLEKGSFDELMKKQGAFFTLWQQQKL